MACYCYSLISGTAARRAGVGCSAPWHSPPRRRSGRDRERRLIAAVEDGAGEVEMAVRPGDSYFRLLKVFADNANDRVAHLAFTLLVPLGIRVGLVGHAEVGAEGIDAHLALFFPFVCEPG